VLSQLLTEMDGLQQQVGVVVVMDALQPPPTTARTAGWTPRCCARSASTVCR
jgi:hypothetical protein